MLIGRKTNGKEVTENMQEVSYGRIMREINLTRNLAYTQSPHVSTWSRLIQDMPSVCIPRCGLRILGQWNLDSWFNFSWYSLSCFLDSNAQDSGFHKEKFTEFQNPVSGLPSMWQNHVKEKHLLLGSALCSTQCYVCSSHYSYPIFN